MNHNIVLFPPLYHVCAEGMMRLGDFIRICIVPVAYIRKDYLQSLVSPLESRIFICITVCELSGWSEDKYYRKLWWAIEFHRTPSGLVEKGVVYEVLFPPLDRACVQR